MIVIVMVVEHVHQMDQVARAIFVKVNRIIVHQLLQQRNQQFQQQQRSQPKQLTNLIVRVRIIMFMNKSSVLQTVIAME